MNRFFSSLFTYATWAVEPYITVFCGVSFNSKQQIRYELDTSYRRLVGAGARDRSRSNWNLQVNPKVCLGCLVGADILRSKLKVSNCCVVGTIASTGFQIYYKKIYRGQCYFIFKSFSNWRYSLRNSFPASLVFIALIECCWYLTPYFFLRFDRLFLSYRYQVACQDSINETAPPILQRLNTSTRHWVELSTSFEQRFQRDCGFY